jgi:hypothetical protein
MAERMLSADQAPKRVVTSSALDLLELGHERIERPLRVFIEGSQSDANNWAAIVRMKSRAAARIGTVERQN